VGVLAVRPDQALLPLTPDQLDLLDALAGQAASGLERASLAGEAERARLAVEAERLRNTLLSSVSHDLRTPLATITGAATTLLQSSLDPATERELKEAIYEEGERLNRLVTNLLDMTRLESGSFRLNRDWQSIEELVGTALARLDRSLRDRPVGVSIPDDLPLVAVDAVLIEQVLVNLIDNVIKYTDPGSPIEIAGRAVNGSVVVEVADQGPGLEPGTEERVFEKFYRGASGQRGFGLGLPICKAIITAHGGTISAANRRPRGTLFRFILPVGETPPKIVEEGPESE
jgi:two-component system sensor histidine kinase KdpD